MRDATRFRWPGLLTLLGLVLVALVFLLLSSSVSPVTEPGPPLSSTPVPTTTTPASTREAVEGLRDSGPATHSQEGQEGQPRPPGR